MRAQFEKISPRPGRSFVVEEKRLTRFDSPWHFHPEIELTLIVESTGRRFVGDSIETFAPGDLVLLGPNLPHFWHNEERAQRPAQARAVVVQFAPGFLGTEFIERPELAAVRRLFARAARGLAFSGRAAADVRAGLEHLPRLEGLAALLELLKLLHRLAGARARPLASAAYRPILESRDEERLARTYTFLTRRFREPLTLPEIARAAVMTPAAFSRYFKRRTGRNVSIFLNELRVEEAARLLRESARSVTEIAHDSGFVTLSSFNRRFRERLGCVPRDYRRTFLEGERAAVAASLQSSIADIR